ncbi:MAG: hypothetical protein HY859_10050 [Caulobacterales bacterium]|nr:hypothetical protein [Caulobacterales bacterium]
MVIFSKGRRSLTVAAIATLLVAAMHTIATFAPPPANDAGLIAMVETLRGYQRPLGLGMAPSMLDIYTALSLTMSLFLVAFAVLGLSFAGDRDASPRTLSRIAMISAGTMGALTVVYAMFRIPPPLVMIAILAILYLVAALRTLRA